jgi:hypothetical protein
MDSETMGLIVVVLSLSSLFSVGYTQILERWDYEPRWTHITVVIGVFFIGMTMMVFSLLGIISWRSFWLLVYSSIAWGIPVVYWYGRRQTRDAEEAQRYHCGNGAQQREV